MVTLLFLKSSRPQCGPPAMVKVTRLGNPPAVVESIDGSGIHTLVGRLVR
jgi:hypothetical protein